MRFLIVTPSCNQLDYLKRCVASVRDQASAEMLVVRHHIQDACSTDGTVEFLQEYISRHPATDPYQLSFASEADEGMYDAVYKGWAAFLEQSDVVAWLNCDEQYLENSLERVADWMEKNPDWEAVFGDALVVRPDGTLLCARRVFVPERYHIATAYLPVFSAAMFLKARSVAEKNLLPDPGWRVLGDIDLVFRMIKAGIITGVLHENLAAFTDSGSNYSLTGPAKEEQVRMMQKIPPAVRILKPFWTVCHRLRKLFSGAYICRPVSYSLYVGDGAARTSFFVNRAPVIWKGR